MYITQAMLWHENKLVAVCVWALSSVRALYAGSLDDVPCVQRSARDDEEKMVKKLKLGATGQLVEPMASSELSCSNLGVLAEYQEKTI